MVMCWDWVRFGGVLGKETVKEIAELKFAPVEFEMQHQSVDQDITIMSYWNCTQESIAWIKEHDDAVEETKVVYTDTHFNMKLNLTKCCALIHMLFGLVCNTTLHCSTFWIYYHQQWPMPCNENNMGSLVRKLYGQFTRMTEKYFLDHLLQENVHKN